MILRLGSDKPTTGDLVAISKICHKTGKPENDLIGACGMSLPVGVLSILYTNKTVKEIQDIYKDAAEEVNDCLPVIIFNPYDPNISFDFYHSDVQEMMIQFEKEHDINNSKCTYSLDELLDKIKRVGMEGLDNKELARLKSF